MSTDEIDDYLDALEEPKKTTLAQLPDSIMAIAQRKGSRPLRTTPAPSPTPSSASTRSSTTLPANCPRSKHPKTTVVEHDKGEGGWESNSSNASAAGPHWGRECTGNDRK